MSGDELAPVSDGAGEDIVGRAAWEVQRVINHWSAVPDDVLAEREAELADLRACRDRIVALAPAPTQAPQADETLAEAVNILFCDIEQASSKLRTPDNAIVGYVLPAHELRRLRSEHGQRLATHVRTIRAEREGGLVIPAAAKLKAGDVVRYLGPGSWELVEPDCPTPGCSGDPNYPAPGRSHNADCTHPAIRAEREDCAEDHSVWREDIAQLESDVEMWKAVAAARADAEQAAERWRQAIASIGYGDNKTEPQISPEEFVREFNRINDEAAEWRESQQWRIECHLAGHPDDEDCAEHDPILRAEQAAARTLAPFVALADEWEADRGIRSPDSKFTRDVMVRELRALLPTEPTS